MLDTEIRDFLRQHRFRLNTDLGQHFLTNEDTLADILCAAELTRSDRIVEIGPGIGILTRELLKRTKHVTAIEIDARIIPLLQTFTAGLGSLEIICSSALDAKIPDSEPYKIVANIPYHITSPLLRHIFLETTRRPTALTLLLQREVAENICSGESASILTVLVGLFGTPRLVRLVPTDAFLPPPEVDSAVIHIDCFAEPKADTATTERILKLVKIAFSQRRKMLSNSIGQTPQGEEALKKASIDASRRPQTLNIAEWMLLEQALSALRT